MNEYRPWVQPFLRVADFLSHRGATFWVTLLIGGAVTAMFLSMFPGDRRADAAAARLADVAPIQATDVLWHVVDGQLQDVSVVVPGPDEMPFTVDLVGVDGGEDVQAYDGWQPAPTGLGAEDYQPPLRVRVDFAQPPVAMREATFREFADGWAHIYEALFGAVGAVVMLLAVVLSIRQDRQLAPPLRRLARANSG